jgi:hypothetical protein
VNRFGWFGFCSPGSQRSGGAGSAGFDWVDRPLVSRLP